MSKEDVGAVYFDWLYDLMCGDRYSDRISYRKLLAHLHDIEFIYVIKNDQSRAEDGLDLRYRFTLQGCDYGYYSDCINGPCTVLEMMIALAIRCEESIMDDARMGNRTGQWFWSMISNLGLGYMNDNRYDADRVDYVINRFLNRDYEPNGKGGLFTVRNCNRDLRDVAIWTQMCWYLDNFINN